MSVTSIVLVRSRFKDREMEDVRDADRGRPAHKRTGHRLEGSKATHKDCTDTAGSERKSSC